jgi:hypothetical protein
MLKRRGILRLKKRLNQCNNKQQATSGRKKRRKKGSQKGDNDVAIVT